MRPVLRKKLGGASFLTFSSVVIETAKKDATVRAIRDDLLEYGELRNAIVHDRGKAPTLLADPRDDVVTQIELGLDANGTAKATIGARGFWIIGATTVVARIPPPFAIRQLGDAHEWCKWQSV